MAEATVAEHQHPSPRAQPAGKAIHRLLPVSLASKEEALRRRQYLQNEQLNQGYQPDSSSSASAPSYTRPSDRQSNLLQPPRLSNAERWKRAAGLHSAATHQPSFGGGDHHQAMLLYSQMLIQRQSERLGSLAGAHPARRLPSVGGSGHHRAIPLLIH